MDPELAAILTEVRALVALSQHPNIVRFIGAWALGMVVLTLCGNTFCCFTQHGIAPMLEQVCSSSVGIALHCALPMNMWPMDISACSAARQACAWSRPSS